MTRAVSLRRRNIAADGALKPLSACVAERLVLKNALAVVAYVNLWKRDAWQNKT